VCSLRVICILRVRKIAFIASQYDQSNENRKLSVVSPKIKKLAAMLLFGWRNKSEVPRPRQRHTGCMIVGLLRW
jgi:hypothetical protein